MVFQILDMWLFSRKENSFLGHHFETEHFWKFFFLFLLIYGCLRCIQIWWKFRTETPTGKYSKMVGFCCEFHHKCIASARKHSPNWMTRNKMKNLTIVAVLRNHSRRSRWQAPLYKTIRPGEKSHVSLAAVRNHSRSRETRNGIKWHTHRKKVTQTIAFARNSKAG